MLQLVACLAAVELVDAWECEGEGDKAKRIGESSQRRTAQQPDYRTARQRLGPAARDLTRRLPQTATSVRCGPPGYAS